MDQQSSASNVQATNTTDTHAFSRAAAVADERRVSGQATTEHGSSLAEAQLLRDSKGELFVAADGGRVTAVADRAIGVFGVVSVDLVMQQS